jgi:hypothetical protein
MKAMKICIIAGLLALVGCNDRRTIVGKTFLPAPCLCGFHYERLGSGESVYFEDSCKFYKIGDIAKP